MVATCPASASPCHASTRPRGNRSEPAGRRGPTRSRSQRAAHGSNQLPALPRRTLTRIHRRRGEVFAAEIARAAPWTLVRDDRSRPSRRVDSLECLSSLGPSTRLSCGADLRIGAVLFFGSEHAARCAAATRHHACSRSEVEPSIARSPAGGRGRAERCRWIAVFTCARVAELGSAERATHVCGACGQPPHQSR